MNMKRRIRSFATFYLLIALALALSSSAGADVFQTLTGSQLTGGLGTFSLDATVYRDLVGSNYQYTYEYALTFVSYGTKEDLAEGFKVGNPSKAPIFGMTNTGDFHNFDSGVYDTISWLNGFMEKGDTITFSYKSFNRPFENPLTVNCYASDGGLTATGQTIGMSAMVPEPSAFMGLAMGILGAFPLMRRRK